MPGNTVPALWTTIVRMPKRKRSYGKRKTSFRRFKRRKFRRGKRKTTRIPNAVSAERRGVIKKLYYVDNYELLTGVVANVIAGSAWRMINVNSLFDPDHQIGGHQPAGFDHMMTQYQQYKVIGFKCEAMFVNHDRSDETGGPINCFLWGSESSSGAANHDTRLIMEDPRSRTTLLGVAESGNEMKKLTYKWSYKMYGKKGDSVQGSSGTNPSDMWYMNFAIAQTTSGHLDNVTVQLKLTYIAKFTQPIVKTALD